MTLRVFISHASPDTAFAQQLADDLRNAGADVWLDATHIGPGNFVQRINQALNARDVLVLVLTPDALASQWVPDEMDAALVRYKQGFMRSPVIVMAKRVPLQDIPGLWTTYNRIDATTNYDLSLPTIAHALGLTLPSPPKPATPVVIPTSKATPPAATPAAQASSSAPAPIAQAEQPLSKAAPALSRRTLLIGTGVVIASTGIGAAVIKLMSLRGGAPAVNSGSLRWSYKTGGPVGSSPALANGMVYIGSDDGNIYALDANTGSNRWIYQTGDKVFSSPTVTNGVVYIGSNDHSVYALNASDGSKRWSYQTGD